MNWNSEAFRFIKLWQTSSSYRKHEVFLDFHIKKQIILWVCVCVCIFFPSSVMVFLITSNPSLLVLFPSPPLPTYFWFISSGLQKQMFRFVKLTRRMREGGSWRNILWIKHINFSAWTSNFKYLLKLFPIRLVSLCSVSFVFILEVVLGHLWRWEVLNVIWNVIWHYTFAVMSFLEPRLAQSTGFTNVYCMSNILMNIFIRQGVQFLPYKIQQMVHVSIS